MVVNADLRGCGHSDGTAQLLSQQEGRDSADLVSGPAPSRGATVGWSCSGCPIWRSASTRPPPSAPRAARDRPVGGIHRSLPGFALPGGVPERGFLRVWGTMLRRTIRQAYDLAAMPRTHPLRDAFWASLTPDLAQIDVPMLVLRQLLRPGPAQPRIDSRVHDGTIRARAALHPPRRKVVDVLFLGRHGPNSWRSSAVSWTTPRRRRDRSAWKCGRIAPPSLPCARRPNGRRRARGGGRFIWFRAGALDRPTTDGTRQRHVRTEVSTPRPSTWTIPADAELTGPMTAQLWLELHGCRDANLFVGVEKWRDGRYVPFEGSFGYGRDRVATGWSRVALRHLDPLSSQPWEPVPTCADEQPLQSGEVAAVNVALGPSATLFRAGEQLRLVVAGRWLAPRNPFFGSFPSTFASSPRGRITLHWGVERAAHLLIPELAAGRTEWRL